MSSVMQEFRYYDSIHLKSNVSISNPCLKLKKVNIDPVNSKYPNPGSFLNWGKLEMGQFPLEPMIILKTFKKNKNDYS
jgi:hypothetical protein